MEAKVGCNDPGCIDDCCDMEENKKIKEVQDKSRRDVDKTATLWINDSVDYNTSVLEVLITTSIDM